MAGQPDDRAGRQQPAAAPQPTEQDQPGAAGWQPRTVRLPGFLDCWPQPACAWVGRSSSSGPMRGYGQDKHETRSGPASPCVEALARPRRRVWPPEGLSVL